MKSYMNTIAENAIATMIIDIREKAVNLKRDARQSFAIGWRKRNTTPTLRFNPSTVIDGVNIYLHYDPMFVWSMGSVGAVGTLVHDPENNLPRENVLDIYYDSAFAKLPAEIQSAIIAHEVGHYKMGHNKLALDGHVPDAKEAFDWEVAADTYAQDLGYSMYYALQYLAQAYRKSLRFEELKQLRQRAMHLQQNRLPAGTGWNIQSEPLTGKDAAFDILKSNPESTSPEGVNRYVELGQGLGQASADDMVAFGELSRMKTKS